MFRLLFGSRKALEILTSTVSALSIRVAELEADWKAQVAALENAADLYNRAAARAERSKPRSNGDSTLSAAGSVDEVRRRRGGF